MATILQKVNRNKKTICPRCIHNNVCIANANQPCFECNQFMEVVRCRDCKHWSEDQYGCVCSLHSQKENEDYPAFEVEMLPHDFCSYGERKDNEIP